MSQEVIKKGVDLEFNSEVTAVDFQGSDSTTTVKDAEGNLKTIQAKFIIDSSGFGRV